MPDASGRFRGISVPELPWQRIEPVRKPQTRAEFIAGFMCNATLCQNCPNPSECPRKRNADALSGDASVWQWAPDLAGSKPNRP